MLTPLANMYGAHVRYIQPDKIPNAVVTLTSYDQSTSVILKERKTFPHKFLQNMSFQP